MIRSFRYKTKYYVSIVYQLCINLIWYIILLREKKIFIKKNNFFTTYCKMNKTIKNEMYNIINEFERIIKINKNKIPKYYLDEDFFGDTKDKFL